MTFQELSSGTVGLVFGAFLWHGFRLIPLLARWVCEPFGKPGKVAMVISLLLSYSFVGLVIVLVFLIAFYFFIENAGEVKFSPERAHTLRGYVFLGSLIGFLLPGLAVKLDGSLRRPRRTKK